MQLVKEYILENKDLSQNEQIEKHAKWVEEIKEKYSNINKYQLIVIDKLPDNKVIHKLLELPLSSYERHYKADNLNHDVINLYF